MPVVFEFVNEMTNSSQPFCVVSSSLINKFTNSSQLFCIVSSSLINKFKEVGSKLYLGCLDVEFVF